MKILTFLRIQPIRSKRIIESLVLKMEYSVHQNVFQQLSFSVPQIQNIRPNQYQKLFYISAYSCFKLLKIRKIFSERDGKVTDDSRSTKV